MIELLVGLVTLIIGLYIYLTWNFDYWEKRGVPYDKPVILAGSLKDIILAKEHIGIHQEKLYKKFEGHPFAGFFLLGRPALLVRDPELLKAVLVKDFDHFVDRNFHADEDRDPTGRNLFNIRGIKWKFLRNKLTPTFTSGKMKMMFPLIADCSDELGELVLNHAKKGDIIEIRDIAARYATDVIATCAFGIQCHSLKNPNAVFREMGRKMFEPTIRNLFAQVGLFLFPKVVNILRLDFLPPVAAKFLRDVFIDTMEFREKKNIYRPDFLQLLLQLKKTGKVDDDDFDNNEKELTHGEQPSKNGDNSEIMKLDMDDLLAQAVLFFNAGFETSSTTMSFALYELAIHSDIQNRLREEIKSVLKQKGNKLTYEAIQEMKYLDMIVSETLRKYPAAPFLDRICTREYKLPGSKIVLPQGFPIFVPVMGLHYDPKYFPEPHKFDPERFTETNKKIRPNYTYLPFGEGPRNCIGNRFGLLQVKVGLVSILRKCEVVRCKKTPNQVIIDSKSFLLSPKGGLYLQLKPVSN